MLAADVAGYTRLMEADEGATLAAWWAAREDVIDPTITEHGGRIVKLTGDGFLAEFATATEAVTCAVAMQTILVANHADTPQDRRFAFRMGINLGEIVDDEEDIYGDGVNIAARIESMAEPGGIWISANIHEQVHKKLEFPFQDMGEQVMKNVSMPVRTFRVALDGDTTTAAGSKAAPAAAAIWRIPKLLLTPLRHLGNDDDTAVLAAGVTETLAAALVNFEEFELIDPGTAEALSEHVSHEAARRLGASYVLEGSVQLAAGKARIGVHLIDAGTGERVWSETLDRDSDDVFALQDDIAAFVASTLGEAVVEEHARAIAQKEDAALDAYEMTVRGLHHLHRVNPQDNQVARGYFEQVLAMGPDHYLPTICLCWTYALELINGWPSSRDDALDYSKALIRDVLRSHERSAHAHRLMGRLLLAGGDHDQGLAHAQRACQLNPHHSDMLMSYGIALVWDGRAGEGLKHLERAFTINPYAPVIYKSYLSFAYFLVGRPEDGLDILSSVQGPVGATRFARIANLVALDRFEDARAEAGIVQQEDPSFDLARLLAGLPFRDEEDRARLGDTLRRAGLGE